MQESKKSGKATGKKQYFYGWKKPAPKVQKGGADLHTKVIVRKKGSSDVTSVIISDKKNPFLNKRVGEAVTIKGSSYEVIAIRPFVKRK